MAQGKYIVIEGADGTGKSTQVELLEKFLLKNHIPVMITQEPGGVAIAEKLRDIIKDGTLPRDSWTNVMLLTASRRNSWFQSIEPALRAGTWVIASRSYISTIAYQGYGEGIDIQKIIDFTRDNTEESYLSPDQVIILTISDEQQRMLRVDGRTTNHKLDTFESKNDMFQTAMQSGYVTFATSHNVPLINAGQSINMVQQIIQETLAPLYSPVKPK